jgi:hypothetical protein
MDTRDRDCEATYRRCLDSFFTKHPNAALQASSLKALRFLMVSGEPLHGRPAGWAAGIVYALTTSGRQPCGVPGILNAELEELFGTTMSTVRKRAAHVQRALTL